MCIRWRSCLLASSAANTIWKRRSYCCPSPTWPSWRLKKLALHVPILINHDQADPDTSCPVRYTTTVPTQALGMLNGEFTNDQAVALAERLKKEYPDDLQAQVTRGIRLTTGRIPKAEEVAKDVAFIAALKAKHKLDDAKALAQYALMLLNTNEFVYLD